MSVTAAARLRKDLAKLMKDPVPYVVAAPRPDNILEWYAFSNMRVSEKSTLCTGIMSSQAHRARRMKAAPTTASSSFLLTSHSNHRLSICLHRAVGFRYAGRLCERFSHIRPVAGEHTTVSVDQRLPPRYVVS